MLLAGGPGLGSSLARALRWGVGCGARGVGCGVGWGGAGAGWGGAGWGGVVVVVV